MSDPKQIEDWFPNIIFEKCKKIKFGNIFNIFDSILKTQFNSLPATWLDFKLADGFMIIIKPILSIYANPVNFALVWVPVTLDKVVKV